MKEKILVTGGAGFIGSYLVDALLARGHYVRVLDNLEPQVHGGLGEQGKWPPYCNPEAEMVLGDIRDLEKVSKALQGIEVVFHLAAMVGVGQSMYAIARYTDVNANGAAVLLQAIVDAKDRPRKLVVASSMSIYGEGAYCCPVHGTVYPRLRPLAQLQAREWELRCPAPARSEAGGPKGANGKNAFRCGLPLAPIPTDEDKTLCPTSIYAINKRDQEEMFLAVGQAYGIPTVALRYFNVYGARQALSNPYTGVAAIFSGRLLNGKPPVIFEDGRQARDFTHVSDIVQANLLAMDSPEASYGVFNVSTGRALTILEVAQALLDHLRPSSSFPISPVIENKFRAGDIRHCYGDISRLQSIGYRPRVPFEDGVAELVEWVRTQAAADGFEQAQGELVHRGLAI